MTLDCDYAYDSTIAKEQDPKRSSIFRGGDGAAAASHKLGEMKKTFGGSVRNKAERLKQWKSTNLQRSSSQSTAESTCQNSVFDESNASSAFSTDSGIVAMMPKAVKMQPIGVAERLGDMRQRIVRRNNSNLPSRRRRPTCAEI